MPDIDKKPQATPPEGGEKPQGKTPEELTQELDALRAEKAQVEEELKGYKSKDYNFKKLRDMTEEEREKLSHTELELKQRQEELEEQQKGFMQQVRDTHINDALSMFAGGDDKLADKIKFHFDRLSDPDATKDQINKKMRDAYILATGGQSYSANPVASAGAYQSGYRPSVKADTELTDDQKDLARRFGLDLEKAKTFKNPYLN